MTHLGVALATTVAAAAGLDAALVAAIWAAMGSLAFPSSPPSAPTAPPSDRLGGKQGVPLSSRTTHCGSPRPASDDVPHSSHPRSTGLQIEVRHVQFGVAAALFAGAAALYALSHETHGVLRGRASSRLHLALSLVVAAGLVAAVVLLGIR